MIKLNELKKLLNIKQEDLSQLNEDQLKILLGAFRYLARLLQREVNRRTSDFGTTKN